MTEPDRFTGYVTFFSWRFRDEVLPDGGLPGIQIVLSSDDCANPLPAS